MKRILTHIIGLLLLMPFISCNESEVPEGSISESQKRVPMSFSTAIPLLELPSSRANITDDSAINNYAIWVFSNGTFLEAIYPDDTYNGQLKVELSRTDYTLKVLLPDGLSGVTLAMVANVPNIKEKEPQSGTTLRNANATFSGSDMDYMPMYGTTGENTFTVSYGGYGGHITLHRAMAKVEVKASGASDHFTLTGMYVYQTNPNGTVAVASSITNETQMNESITGSVENTTNSAFVYLPEVKIEIEKQDTKTMAKTFVLIKGTLKGVEGERWFKLDFIERKESSGQIAYSYLDALKRNHCYVFDIQYLTQGVSYASANDAIAEEASNKIIGESTELIIVDNDYIMDITTNNYIYLGVTAGNVSTTTGSSYHVANISIVTNSANGWKFESLPEGVDVSIPEYKPASGATAEVISVWVYLDKNKYKSGESVTIYVYGDNIRKSITITVS